MNRRPVILFVDDNPDDVSLLEAAFAQCRAGVELHSVQNGVQAYDFLSKRGEHWNAPTPDLILLDLNLPVRDGRAVLREFQKDPIWRRIPVVVFSSTHRQEEIDECYRLGACLYVVKPAHFDRYAELASSFAKMALR
jgi:two-component system response regulator